LISRYLGMKMKTIYGIGLVFSLSFLVACGGEEEIEETNSPAEEHVGNPPAEGFDLENSDPKAIAIADEVMEAMGGRKAWDDTQYITWVFGGARTHYWNKQTGDIRVDFPRYNYQAIMNINTMKGRVKMDSVELSHPDSLEKYLDLGKQMWVNDAYWLVMPFKLKDSGVTLKYVGEDTIIGGTDVEVLELRFKDVGYTPDQKYRVYIDAESKLMVQWAFYGTTEKDTADIVSPWDNYQTYGNIKLSGGDGEKRVSAINVMDSLPPNVMNSFDPVEPSIN
jgi:hypothetical protein